jgi:hypothetical protein
MLAADRSQAEASVLRGVRLPARAEEAQVDEADAGGKHPLPAQAGPSDGARDRLTDSRQRRAELQHPVMFAPVPLLAPQIVVPILAASCRSVPTAWMWPSGSAQIHTSSQAGGMTAVICPGP